MTGKSIAGKAVALLGAVAMVGSLAACGNSSSEGGKAVKLDENKKISLKVWAWDAYVPTAAKNFMKQNPNITIKVDNVGTNKDEYTALDNAIKAGKGAPDIAQIEYYALPQYAINKQLRNLADYGAKDFKDFFTPGTWSSVAIMDGVYGLPMDSGPMAFFYNKEVFDKAGVTEVPKTWDQFYEAAKKIRKVGSYITSDAGDAGFYDSMTWAFGGRPFKTDGTNVTMKLTSDEGVKKFTEFWQKMIDEDLIDTKTVGWTDDWNRGLGDGSIASLLLGAWMPGNLLSGAAQAAGKWRVATMPTLKEGETANAENGGSSMALLAGNDDQKAAAAYKFAEFFSHNKDVIKDRVAGGAFPADNDTLKDPDFLNMTTLKDKDKKDVAYFGGQKFNEVLAQAAKDVSTGYTFLPFEVYARGIYGDTAGAAFTKKTTLAKGIEEWQKKIASYGNDQGFTVKTE